MASLSRLDMQEVSSIITLEFHPLQSHSSTPCLILSLELKLESLSCLTGRLTVSEVPALPTTEEVEMTFQPCQ